MTTPPILTLGDVLDSLELEQVNAEFFVGQQIDEIAHHISGGHIAAQALMAASRTVSDRPPHSMHMYFLRAGDARQPVDFEVTALHDGGTFSARRVTARQFGECGGAPTALRLPTRWSPTALRRSSRAALCSSQR